MNKTEWAARSKGEGKGETKEACAVRNVVMKRDRIIKKIGAFHMIAQLIPSALSSLNIGRRNWKRSGQRAHGTCILSFGFGPI